MSKRTIILRLGNLASCAVAAFVTQYLDRQTRLACHWDLTNEPWSYDLTHYLAAGGTAGLLILIWQHVAKWWEQRVHRRP